MILPLFNFPISCLLLCFNPTFKPVLLFSKILLEALFGKKVEFKYLVCVTDHISCTHSHALIVLFISAYRAFLKYVLASPLIPYIFLLSWSGAFMHLFIIALCVNTNTGNSQIAFAHMYFFYIHIQYHILYHSLRKNFLVHLVNKRFYMFKCSSRILRRFIWNM